MAILAELHDLGDQYLIITQTRSVELLEPTETMGLTDCQLATDYDLLLDDYCTQKETRMTGFLQQWRVRQSPGPCTPRACSYTCWCQASTDNIDVEMSFSLKRAVG